MSWAQSFPLPPVDMAAPILTRAGGVTPARAAIYMPIAWFRLFPSRSLRHSRANSRNCVNWLRSEEHTSELQSRGHLVCRLLLEKKKKNLNVINVFKKKKKKQKK